MPEYVTLVNEKDEVTGSKNRDELTNDDRWRIVTIWVTNSQGEVLIAKRALNKRINPGKWGPSVAGTVEHGDGYDETAVRELEEELGVKAELTPLKVIFYASSLGKRACMGYRALVNQPIEAFTFPPDEVAEIKWIDENKLWEDAESHPEEYIPELAAVKELFRS